MKNKLIAKEALKIIQTNFNDLNIQPIDSEERTKANGFAIGGEHGKQFILILGGKEGAKQTRIITEKIPDLDLPAITGVAYRPEIYKGARVNQPKSSLGYKNRLKNGNQSSFNIDSANSLEQLIRWYATNDLEQKFNTEKSTEIKPHPTPAAIELSDDQSFRNNDQYDDIFEVSSQTIEQTTKEQLIQARLGQGKFRQNVINTWGIGECCAVTGINIKQLLIASHIIPWRESNNNQRLSGANGIMLCSHFDKLFDQYLISFDTLGQLVISSRLNEIDLKCLENIGVYGAMRLNTNNLNTENISSLAININVHYQTMTTLDITR